MVAVFLPAMAPVFTMGQTFTYLGACLALACLGAAVVQAWSSARARRVIVLTLVLVLALGAGAVFADTIYSPYCDGYWFYIIAACWGLGF